MSKFCRKVKEFFKSCIKCADTFLKKNKKAIIKGIGKFVIFVCKSVIESFFDGLF